MSNRSRIAEELKGWAREAGFDRAGVASLEPSIYGEALRHWLARGDHAEMAWIARRVEVREDPAQLLPGARSVLCVALQYHPRDDEPPAEGDLWPRVARYARGRDYHDVMGRQLRDLAARIREAYPQCGTRPYVDTGPVLERELAARAGLGVFGKNTNLLDRRWGSYFLLGELLLTLDLAPDEPVHDLCGRCTRCLDACPTDALRAPYRLDSRRCISYWTIEHRGDLPEAVRPMLEDWVFGCDICQEVCPYNRKARPARHEALRLPEGRRQLDLQALVTIDRETYVERFRHSPMKRAKQAGLQRNAAVAMGNRGDRRYVPSLLAVLGDAEVPSMVRRHAAWALGRIGGDAARRGLGRASVRAAGDGDQELFQEVERALARCPAEGGSEAARGAGSEPISG